MQIKPENALEAVNTQLCPSSLLCSLSMCSEKEQAGEFSLFLPFSPSRGDKAFFWQGIFWNPAGFEAWGKTGLGWSIGPLIRIKSSAMIFAFTYWHLAKQLKSQSGSESYSEVTQWGRAVKPLPSPRNFFIFSRCLGKKKNKNKKNLPPKTSCCSCMKYSCYDTKPRCTLFRCSGPKLDPHFILLINACQSC